MTGMIAHWANKTEITAETITLHRPFWEAGFRVCGLHSTTTDGHCDCGKPACKAVLKHPRVSNWQHTPHWSEDQLETMEAMGQFATGYGIVCRFDDDFDLLVVDVDARNGGLQDYQKLLERVPEVAGAGLIVNTGSGGGSKHLYFKVPKGMALLTKLYELKGIDFKSGSAYVVGPGSLHASGNRYEIAYGSPSDIDLAPQALLDMLVKPEHHRADLGGQTVDVSHHDLADMLRYVDGYDSYDDWIKVGMALHHASGGAAFVLWDRWSQRSLKYDAEEMTKKWRSFGNSTKPVTLGTLVHLAEQGGWKQPVTFVPDVEFVGLKETNGWPEPEMRFLGNRGIPAPLLPLENLVVDSLAKTLRHVADAKGAPVDYVFVALLTSSAALLSNHVVASPQPGWTEATVIWSVIVGEPSAGKSPALDAVTSIMKSVEREVNAKESKLIDDWDEKDKVYQAALKKWQKDVEAAVNDGDPPPQKPASTQSQKRPQRSRLVLNDATIERLAEILGGQEIGILQFRDEIAGWLQGMTRYAQGSSDRAFWLEAYGGRSYAVERMTREVTVDRLAICVLGGIQPDRMNTLLLGADDDGLLARLMPIWPDPVPINEGIGEYDDSLVRHVLVSLHRRVEATVHVGQNEPLSVRFHDQAQKKLLELRQRLRKMENDEEGLTKSFLGKLAGLTVRVSLVLAYINAAAKDGDFPIQISDTDFEAAQTFTMEYILPMVRRCYEMASVSNAERAARQILWLAKTNGWRDFRVSQIKRRGRTGLTVDKDLEAAISMLVAADWIKEEKAQKTPKGGRPTITYHVNPRLWDD
jgi:hypothetical protein